MASEFNNCTECNFDFNSKDIYQHFLDEYNKNGGYQYTKTVEEILKSAALYPEQYLPLPDFSAMTQHEIDAWNSARMYGWTFENPKCFRNEIGIEIHAEKAGDYGYDGISLYQCPECGYAWKRFPWVPDSVVEQYNGRKINVR